MATTPPATVADFKAQFTRGFVYGKGTDKVRDEDIQAAINEAVMFWNPCLWETAEKKPAFLYAVAHLLVSSLQAAGGLSAQPNSRGTQNKASGVIVNASVGGVSKGVQAPPEWVTKSSFLLQFWETDYGKRYLAMLGPRLVGACFVAEGNQDPTVADQGNPFTGP